MAKKAATILAEAQQDLLETNARLSDTGRRRDQLLLAGDERGLDAIEGELAGLQKAAVRQADRIRLLEEQARQEEAAAVVKRRGDLVVDSRRSSPRPIAKPTNCRTSSPRLKRSSVASLNCGLMPGPHGRSATRTPTPLRALPKAPLCRAPPSNGCFPGTCTESERGRFLAGDRVRSKRKISPAPLSPRNEVRGRPLDITPFADALRAASKFAVDMMKGKGKLDPLAALPPAGNGQTSHTDETPSPGPVRSDQQERLAALLKKQAALAEEHDPGRRGRLSGKSSRKSPRFHRSNKSWLIPPPRLPQPI